MEPEKVSSMIFSKALSVDPENDSNFAVINPFVKLEVPFLPTMFTMNVTSLISPVDMRGNRSFELKLKNPDGKIIFSTGNFSTNFDDNEENNNMTFNYQHGITNVELNKQGLYECELLMGDSILVSNKFLVSKENKEV